MNFVFTIFSCKKGLLPRKTTFASFKLVEHIRTYINIYIYYKLSNALNLANESIVEWFKYNYLTCRDFCTVNKRKRCELPSKRI